MENINTVETRRPNTLRLKLAAAGLGMAALLSGCSDASYSGESHEFQVRGKVTDAGDESLKVEVYQINSAAGKADGWFTVDQEHRLHDNCNCHGAWTGNKQYGQVLDVHKREIEPSEVDEGACVEFDGKIRSNQSGKTYQDRPVYDTAQIITCGS